MRGEREPLRRPLFVVVVVVVLSKGALHLLSGLSGRPAPEGEKPPKSRFERSFAALAWRREAGSDGARSLTALPSVFFRRYYFKKASDEFECGAVFEEVSEDGALLPTYEGKILGKVERME